MDIIFKSSKLRKELSESRQTERRHGERRAKLLRSRLDSMAAADNLDHLRSLPQTNAHELTQNRAGQLAVDLDQPFRLIFEPANDPVPRKADGGLDWTQVTAVRILDVIDYHDKKNKK